MVSIELTADVSLDEVLRNIREEANLATKTLAINCELKYGQNRWTNADDIRQVFDTLRTAGVTDITALDFHIYSYYDVRHDLVVEQFFRYISECLLPRQTTCPSLKELSLTGLTIPHTMMNSLASIEGLESVKYHSASSKSLSNYYLSFLKCTSLRSLDLCVFRNNFKCLDRFVKTCPTDDGSRTTCWSTLEHLSLHPSCVFLREKNSDLLLCLAKLIGHSNALRTLTVNGYAFSIGDTPGCCDDFWKALGVSLGKNSSLISLTLPIDPIISKPDGEEARLALLNGLKNNYTLKYASVSVHMRNREHLVEAYGLVIKRSLFVHEDSRPFECYLDMNRRGRKAFAYSVDDAVHSNIESVGEENSMGWIKALKKKGDKNFDLDWIYHVSRSNPLSLVWLRDSMINKRRGNNVPKRKRGSGKKDATASKKPSARSK